MTTRARRDAVRRLRVVQVSFVADRRRRNAEALLQAWPTLPGVATAVARAGVDVSVVQASTTRETVVRDGVTYHFIDDVRGMPQRVGPVPLPRRPRRLLDCVTALAPDVVHVQGLHFPLAVYQLARSVPRVPVLAQDHGTVAPKGLRGIAWGWVSRFLDGVAFTARDQATPFFASGAFRSDLPVFEIVEGSTTFTPGDQEVARRSTAMFGDPCLLWTGRLDANKDPLTALRAFELAAPRLPDARLWCCYGAAPLLADVERQIVESPILRERVRLLGTRPHAELEHRFRAADLFVQTSHREGSGYSVLEALACGATPLVTDIPSLRRIVGRAGSLTPVGDVKALAAAIVEWSARDRPTLRRAARDRFDDALTYEAIGRDLRAVYEHLAADR
jgi:glycosyltransferase involved in cell wall biosynthesis